MGNVYTAADIRDAIEADRRERNQLTPTAAVLTEVAGERTAQDARWAEQNHPDGTGPEVVWAFTGPAAYVAECATSECQRLFDEGFGSWRDILTEEIAEAYAEADPAKLRAELIQVAAVATAWVEAIDRRTAATESPVS